MLKNDIERFHTEDIPLNKLLIDTIPAKTRKQFVDPFVYKENEEAEGQAQADKTAATPVNEE
jgi:hypothetical protein